MPSVTPVLWTHKTNAKGLAPIYLRIQASGKTRYVSLKTYVRESQWNPNQGRVRKGHKHSKRINSMISARVAEAEEEILKIHEQRERLSAEKLKRRVKQDVERADALCFLAYADGVNDDFEKRGSIWTARRQRTVIRKLEDYSGRPLPFDRLTPAFLHAYETHLLTKHKNKQNTVAGNFRVIRAILYRAIREGLADQGKNPFFQFKVKKGKAHRDKLTIEQIRAIENLDLQVDSLIWHVRNYFLFSFYCAGIRFGDLARMRCEHVRGGRLDYVMHKTGTRKQLNLLPKAQAIADHYVSDDPEAYLFPILTGYDTSTAKKEVQAISSQNALINKYLKKLAARAGIEENVSFHVSRHSFADIARTSGMDIYNISKALGHSDLKVTEAYLKGFDAESLDESMESLFGGDDE